VREHAERSGLPLGKRFSANLGSPVFAFARADEPALAYPALQIAHYYMPEPGSDGFVIESWYNPPGANAAIVPGYLDVHFARMKQYARTVAAAPLVGSRASGRIRLRDGRLRVELPIGAQEVERLGRGLVTLAGAFLRGGVDHALVSIGAGRVLRRAADLRALEHEFLRMQHDLARVQMLRFGTGHPQGGNAMSDDPAIGVIDGSFRVRGVSNLRICDGSIFPDSSGVNPQWTILALADRCAARMTEEG
jgi:choline dehydrogenase-like flavoprotein